MSGIDDADLIVIGGGTAGLAAARTAVRSRRTRRTVIMVQDGPVGGDCTFTGCVPSKTLIEAGEAGCAFDEAMDRVRDAVGAIAATETADVLRGEGVDVIEGRARFVAPDTVQVGDRQLRSRRLVVATGSAPARPAVPGVRDPRVLDCDSVWSLSSRPDSLAVLGGGPAGCELAQAMARFGVRVTLVEAADRLLPGADPRASAVLTDVFGRAGIEVRTGADVSAVSFAPDGTVAVDVGGQPTVHADRLLVATGRSPRTADLGLDAAGLAVDGRGYLPVRDTMATAVRSVWAAGDVTGRMLTTHAADEMGRAAATNALHSLLRLTVHEATMPQVVFTDPEIAQVGVLESEAADGDLVAHLPMTAVDRAVTAGRTEGFVAVVVRPRLGVTALGRVVGATIVAPRAGEMVHELALALRARTPVVRLAQTVHAYPTWSVAIRSTAAQFLFDVDGRTARPVRSAPTG